MFDRIANSYQLLKASAAILREDKTLLIYPIVSGIAVLIVTLSFAIPLFAVRFVEIATQSTGGQVAGAILAFLFYLTQYFIIIFANAALMGAAMNRLRGQPATFGDGFWIAVERVPAIFGYALIAATVGLALRLLSQRAGIIGQIAAALIGVAWNVVTYLAVPVLVVEDVGPIQAIKRSAGLLRRTWGEQLVGNLSLGLVYGLVGLIVVVFALAGGLLMLKLNFLAGALALGVVAVLLLLAGGIVVSTLNAIYQAAVYRYAIEGQAGRYFDEALLRQAFRPKKAGLRF